MKTPAKLAIYLDANAGAPLKPEVKRALQALLQDDEVFLPNPSSSHSHGRKAKRLVSEARAAVAHSLGSFASPETITFHSSGTEANQMVIRAACEQSLAQRGSFRWVTTPVEHDSVLQMIPWVISRGGKVDLLTVDSTGKISLDSGDIGEADLVSLIWVNNETGIISDVTEAVRHCQAKRIPLHLDAAQAWGKLPLQLSNHGPLALTFSAHKIGAFSGVGVLWQTSDFPAQPLILGKQERGKRGGTENLIGIISVGAAASTLHPVKWDQTVRMLRDRLEQRLLADCPGLVVVGKDSPRVGNTSLLLQAGYSGDALAARLDREGFSVSTGSACMSGATEPSHVLEAMGIAPELATAAIRVSLTGNEDWQSLESFATKWGEAVKKA